MVGRPNGEHSTQMKMKKFAMIGVLLAAGIVQSHAQNSVMTANFALTFTTSGTTARPMRVTNKDILALLNNAVGYNVTTGEDTNQVTTTVTYTGQKADKLVLINADNTNGVVQFGVLQGSKGTNIVAIDPNLMGIVPSTTVTSSRGSTYLAEIYLNQVAATSLAFDTQAAVSTGTGRITGTHLTPITGTSRLKAELVGKGYTGTGDTNPNAVVTGSLTGSGTKLSEVNLTGNAFLLGGD